MVLGGFLPETTSKKLALTQSDLIIELNKTSLSRLA